METNEGHYNFDHYGSMIGFIKWLSKYYVNYYGSFETRSDFSGTTEDFRDELETVIDKIPSELHHPENIENVYEYWLGLNYEEIK